MLALTIVTIFVSIMFVFAIWYASYRSKQRSKLFKVESQQLDYLPEQPEHEFGSLLQEQMSELDKPQLEEVQAVDLESEPNVTLSQAALASDDHGSRHTPVSEEVIEGEFNIGPEIQVESIETPVDIAEEMIFTLTVMAQAGQDFSGEAVLTLLTNQALQYGDMAIFHKYATHDKHILYSVADVVKPGRLEMDLLANRRIKGLVFFMSEPFAENGLSVFDDMLNTAKTIAATLNGKLCDGQRQPMQEVEIEQLRSQIFNCDLNRKTHSDQF